MIWQVQVSVVIATMALAGCADWKSIGYLEPGGSPPGASKVSGENCSTKAYIPVLYNAVEKALAKSGTLSLQNVEIVLDPFPTLCATVTGEPIK